MDPSRHAPSLPAEVTPEEFLAKVREVYPEYAQVPDLVLADRIGRKYPQFRHYTEPLVQKILRERSGGEIKAAPGPVGRTLIRSGVHSGLLGKILAPITVPMAAVEEAVEAALAPLGARRPLVLGGEFRTPGGAGPDVGAGIFVSPFLPTAVGKAARGVAEEARAAIARLLSRRPSPRRAPTEEPPPASTTATAVERKAKEEPPTPTPTAEDAPAPPAATPSPPPAEPPAAAPPLPRPRGASPLDAPTEPPLPAGIRGALASTLGYAGYTLLGRLEAFGPWGKEAARLLSRWEEQTDRFLGQHIVPLAKALHRLSPEEKANFVAVVDKGATPLYDSVREILPQYQEIFGPTGLISTLAQKHKLMLRTRSGKAIPWQPREVFYPHEFDPDVARELLRHGSKRREEAIEALVKTGQAGSRVEAEKLLERYFRSQLRPTRGGGLEFARELDIPGYIMDPERAILARGWKAGRLFAGRTILGPNNRQLNRLVEQIGRAYGRAKGREALRLIEQIYYRGEADRIAHETLAALARGATSFQALTKLPLAFIVNATQTAWTAVRTDIGTTLRAVLGTLGRERAAKVAEELGVLSELSMRQLWQELGTGGRFVTGVLMPFNIVERYNRTVAALAGLRWAQKIERHLEALSRPVSFGSGYRRRWLERELTRLNFSRREIENLLKVRRLTDDDKARIAWAIVDQTQYLQKAARRSEFFNTDLGRVMGQFKSFGINTARLFKQSVLEEARHGNFLPLARMLAIFPIVGEVATDLRAILTRRKRRGDVDTATGILERLLENIASVGSIGITHDLLTALYQGRAGAWLLGPTVSDVAQASANLLRAVDPTGTYVDRERAWLALFRQAVRNIPYVGPGIAESYLRPSLDRQVAGEERELERLLLPRRKPFAYREELQKARRWEREKRELTR